MFCCDCFFLTPARKGRSMAEFGQNLFKRSHDRRKIKCQQDAYDANDAEQFCERKAAWLI